MMHHKLVPLLFHSRILVCNRIIYNSVFVHNIIQFIDIFKQKTQMVAWILPVLKI